MDAALRGDAAAVGRHGPPLRIRTVISGAPAGAPAGRADATTAYEVTVGGDDAGVRRVGAAEERGRRDEQADGAGVMFVADHETAVAIASGRESAQGAFMAGR